MKKWLVTLGIVVVIAIISLVFVLLNRNTTYTITFLSENGTSNEVLEVEKDGTIKKIADPIKEGYTFKGWYIDGEEFDFSKKVTESITLTAKWEEIKEDEISVTFDTDGGSSIEVSKIKKGEVVTKPADPTKTGFIFVEWSLNGKKYDFTNKLEENATLVAIWKEDTSLNITKYTVTFDSNDGSKINSKTVAENSSVTKPSNPTKTNYNFVEWTLDGKKYDFSTKVTKNITLIAKWEEKDKVTVTFNSNGGTSVSSREVYEGATLGTLPTNPSKTGFTFDGWYNGNTKYTSSSKISANITLTAKWIDNDEIALNNAKAKISSSYNITEGGQSIRITQAGCTITFANPTVIAKITRELSDRSVTLNFNIVCGSKTGIKNATGIIKKSTYVYSATANSNMQNYDVTIKSGSSKISDNGKLYTPEGDYLSDITSGKAIINNNDINGNPNYLISLGDDNTLFIIKHE